MSVELKTSRLIDAWEKGQSTPAEWRAVDSECCHAARLMIFLRWVEDNAKAYGLTFGETERIAEIAQAYGSSFYKADDLREHVMDLADRLGLDADAFDRYMRGISQSAFQRMFATLDSKPGSLCEDKTPGVGRAIVEGLRTFGHADKQSGHISYYWDAMLMVRLLTRLLGKRKRTLVCDPLCGRGGFLTMALEMGDDLGKLQLSGMDTDPSSIAIASMRLLMDGYSGPLDLRVGDALSGATTFENGPFDGVLCEPYPTRYEVTDDYAHADKPPFGLFKSHVYYRETELRAIMRAADLLSADGVAIMLLSRAPGFSAGVADLRRQLVEDNIMDASIELPRAFLDSRDEASFVWVLRKGRKADDKILLLNVDGDGAKAVMAEAKEESGSHKQPHPFQWIVDAVADHTEIPFAARDVSRDEVLATKDASLRYATFGNLVDMNAEMDKLPSMDELSVRRATIMEEMEKADKEFQEAMRGLK